MAIPVHSKPSALATHGEPATVPCRRRRKRKRSDPITLEAKANTEQKQLSGTCGREQPDETWRPRPGPAAPPAPTLPPNHRSPSVHSTRCLDPIARPPRGRAFFLGGGRLSPEPFSSTSARKPRSPAPARHMTPPPSAAPRHATPQLDAMAGGLGLFIPTGMRLALSAPAT